MIMLFGWTPRAMASLAQELAEAPAPLTTMRISSIFLPTRKTPI
jgi:hypothetical protein